MSVQTVPNYELIALSKLLKDYNKELLLELSPEMFTKINKNLYKLINEYFLTHSKLPTLTTFKAYVLQKAPIDVRNTVTGILHAIDKTDTKFVSNEEIIRGLRDKQLLTSLDEKMKELVRSTANKDVDNIRSILNDLIIDINSSGIKPESLKDALKKPAKAKIIPTCLNGLDDIITGYSGLSIIGAKSGGGKSIFMLNTAIEQFKKGKSILFISLELSAQVLGHRIASYLTGIDYSRILADAQPARKDSKIKLLTEEEKKQIDKALEDFFDREETFRVVTDPLSADELVTLINVEKAINDIDVIYVDYLNLVYTGGGDKAWVGLTDLVRQLHRMSMSLGVVIISAVQVNIEKKPKGDEFPEITTRGSKELINSSSLFLYIDHPDEQPNTLIIYVLKNRIGKTTRILADKEFKYQKIIPVMEI